MPGCALEPLGTTLLGSFPRRVNLFLPIPARRRMRDALGSNGPNQVTYSTLVHACVRLGEFSRARSILRWMRLKGRSCSTLGCARCKCFYCCVTICPPYCKRRRMVSAYMASCLAANETPTCNRTRHRPLNLVCTRTLSISTQPKRAKPQLITRTGQAKENCQPRLATDAGTLYR